MSENLLLFKKNPRTLSVVVLWAYGYYRRRRKSSLNMSNESISPSPVQVST